MMFILMGVIGFVLYFIYDINSVIWKNKALHQFFLIASVLIMIGTVGTTSRQILSHTVDAWRSIIFGGLAIVFLGILVYTLFFALPFETTYIEESKERKVYDKGVYALCRHPGVLWFIGVYCCLWLAVGGKDMLLMAVLYSMGNFLYIVLQDRWTFLRTFTNYKEYQETTPFLIPNKNSIQRCFDLFTGGEKSEKNI